MICGPIYIIDVIIHIISTIKPNFGKCLYHFIQFCYTNCIYHDNTHVNDFNFPTRGQTNLQKTETEHMAKGAVSGILK